MRVVSILLIIAGMLETSAQPVKVGLYQDQLITGAVVYFSAGDYQLLTDGTIVSRMGAGDIL